MPPSRLVPDRECPRCPRLQAYRERLRQAHPNWHNAPVASFGDPEGRLLVVGLAPGAGGANRTGRPFTGDFAGDLLYGGLQDLGLGRGRYAARPDDHFSLADCRITNAVRCVPPENRPTGNEVGRCRSFLVDELRSPPAPHVVLALGRIAWNAVLRALDLPIGRHPFAHGKVERPEAAPVLVATYHTSRYNVNTGRLTREMFEAVLRRVATLLDLPGRPGPPVPLNGPAGR